MEDYKKYIFFAVNMEKSQQAWKWFGVQHKNDTCLVLVFIHQTVRLVWIFPNQKYAKLTTKMWYKLNKIAPISIFPPGLANRLI